MADRHTRYGENIRKAIAVLGISEARYMETNVIDLPGFPESIKAEYRCLVNEANEQYRQDVEKETQPC